MYCSLVHSVDAVVSGVVMLAVVVYSSDCWRSLSCHCFTSMDHIRFVGHTIDLFHVVSVLVQFQTRCRLLFWSLLPNVQVDRKCNNLTLDSFLFLSVVLCPCLFLCLLWLVVLAAIGVCLYLFLCCSCRNRTISVAFSFTVVLSFAFT